MKLFAKISICSMLVLSIAVLFSGYLLLTFSFEGAVKRETQRALSQYQYDKFSVQAGLIANAESAGGGGLPNDSLLRGLASELNGGAAFFSADKTLMVSNLPTELSASLPIGVTDTTIVHALQQTNGKAYLTVCGKIKQSNVSLYLLIATDISEVFTQKTIMLQSFKNVYFITILVSMVIVLCLSALLTRPIKRLTKAADRIAQGNYDERLLFHGGDEIAELSASFNSMTDAVEDKVNELSQNARQKEDFVASFAHEIKTPMTSVIGYADMLYQKALSADEVKNAAWYILNEGLRLEALSLKLMDLIMLGRRDFVLEEMYSQELLQNIADGLRPLLEEKQVTPHFDISVGVVCVEYDLFKTLLLNLIDNSVKAGCTDIWICGRQADSRSYHISIRDNGRGIPANELSRITEAFYMVDKSRSRKQHGVGLGLSLALRIAEIHGGPLTFSSDGHSHTTVEFDLRLGGGEAVEQSS